MSVSRPMFFHFIREHRFLYCTYLVILFIPLSAFLLCIINAGSIMRQDARRYQNSVLTHEKSVCDNVLRETKIAVNTAALTPETNLLKRETVFSPDSMLSVRRLSSSLSDLRNSYPYLESLGIYFYANDSFVTDAKRYAPALYPSWLDRFGLSINTLTGETETYSGYYLWNHEGRAWLLVYQNLYDYSLKKRTALAYAILPWDAVQNADSYSVSPESEIKTIFVIDQNNFLFGLPDSSIAQEQFPSYEALKQADADSGPFSLARSDTSLISGIASDELPFYYGMYLEKDKFYHRINRLLFQYGLALALCVISGICAALYFTKKNAQPIGYLLSLIDNSRKSDKGLRLSASYRGLESALIELQRKNRRLTRQANLHDESVFEATLSGFLKGIWPDTDQILEFHDSEPAIKDIDDYRIAMFSFSDIGECGFIREQGETQKAYSLLFFSLRNVIDEAFLKRDTDIPRGISLLLDGRIVCLFSAPSTGTDSREDETPRLVSDAKTCIDFFENVFALQCRVSISRVYSDWAMLSEAFDEAFTTASHAAFWGEPAAVSFYEEASDASSPGGSGLLALKKKLVNSLIADNYDIAGQLINEIVDRHFLHDVRHFTYNQYQAYALISILIDKLGDMEIGHEIFESYTAQLLHAQTTAELKQEIAAVFSELLRCQKQSASETGWAESVKEYIRANYRNPDLNVAYIAEHFSVSAAHIGNRFRRLTGTGILDYVHMTRLARCRELLAQGDTIRDCATAVGYTDIKTLQRAFKRYEGMTPGQYRDSLITGSCDSSRPD